MPGPHGGVRASRVGFGRLIQTPTRHGAAPPLPRSMSRFALLALTASLAACAPSAPTAALAPSHPAAADAPAVPARAPLADLAPAPQPNVPAVLRPRPMAGMDHGQMDHGQMDHGQMPSPDRETAPDAAPSGAGPLADAVDAYLAVHDALAADRLDSAAADRLAGALAQATTTAPTDDPHLWHRMPDDVTAAQAAAAALRQSETLDQARAAFGDLGVPFSAIAAASGSADGLVRHTCGMTDAPQGGVWLQRDGPPRNPFFGSAMLTCSRDAQPATTR